MTVPRRIAAIAGVHVTAQGRRLDRTEESLKLEAIKGALAEAGLSFGDVDGIVPMESQMHGSGLSYTCSGPSSWAAARSASWASATLDPDSIMGGRGEITVDDVLGWAG